MFQKRTKIEKINDLIKKEIAPLYDKYNDHAINCQISKEYTFNEEKPKLSLYIPTDVSIGGSCGSVFALKTPDLTSIHISDNHGFKEIVTRIALPYSLLLKDKEIIKTNLILNYNLMFNKIKEYTDIDPNTPFIGKAYFQIALNGIYAQLLQDSNAWEIRGYHNSLHIEDFRKEN